MGEGLGIFVPLPFLCLEYRCNGGSAVAILWPWKGSHTKGYKQHDRKNLKPDYIHEDQTLLSPLQTSE